MIKASVSVRCSRCGLEKYEQAPLHCPTCLQACAIIQGAIRKFPPLKARCA